jgi:hypothetical protein
MQSTETPLHRPEDNVGIDHSLGFIIATVFLFFLGFLNGDIVVDKYLNPGQFLVN